MTKIIWIFSRLLRLSLAIQMHFLLLRLQVATAQALGVLKVRKISWELPFESRERGEIQRLTILTVDQHQCKVRARAQVLVVLLFTLYLQVILVTIIIARDERGHEKEKNNRAQRPLHWCLVIWQILKRGVAEKRNKCSILRASFYRSRRWGWVSFRLIFYNILNILVVCKYTFPEVYMNFVYKSGLFFLSEY